MNIGGYQSSNSEDTPDAILKIKLEYSQNIGQQVGNYIGKLKQTHFELGGKAD